MFQKEISDALMVAEEKPEDTIYVIRRRLRLQITERLSEYYWVSDMARNQVKQHHAGGQL